MWMDFSRSIEYFYKNVTNTSSDDISNGASELMMAAATLIHVHNERHMPQYRMKA
jgi:hypothetical protein